MVMRVAKFAHLPEVDAENHALFLQWLGEQPGMLGGWHGTDPATGAVVSVSVWRTREDLLAIRDKRYPGPPLGLKPDEVVVYDVARAFGPSAV